LVAVLIHFSRVGSRTVSAPVEFTRLRCGEGEFGSPKGEELHRYALRAGALGDERVHGRGPRVPPAAAHQDAQGTHPATGAARVEDQQIEQSVVGPGRREERETALYGADVGHEHHAGRAVQDGRVVEPERQPHPGRAQ
jgi:hypothetical protein